MQNLFVVPLQLYLPQAGEILTKYLPQAGEILTKCLSQAGEILTKCLPQAGEFLTKSDDLNYSKFRALSLYMLAILTYR